LVFGFLVFGFWFWARAPNPQPPKPQSPIPNPQSPMYYIFNIFSNLKKNEINI